MTEITDNTIYYTLSTISQTMAALFAVIGTFVIFQIQATESRLISLLTNRANSETRFQTQAQANVKTLIAAKKFKEANESFAMPDPNGGLINNDINKLAKYKNLIKTTIVLSSITIFVSILMLGLVDQIKTACFFDIFFFATIAIFIITLIIMLIKILNIFK